MQSEFEIFAVDVAAGQVAISPCPGRFGTYENDLSALLAWKPDLVLTMTSFAELERVGAAGLGDDLAAIGIEWRHLPIIDFGAPDAKAHAIWHKISADAETVLANGGRILIHCFGGCGRSGMAALRLMIEAGENADVALARLRKVRPCAVETDAQRVWASNISA